VKRASQDAGDDAGSRVISAAVAQVRRDGVAVSLDRISLEDAIAASGVPRATAYRRWPSKREFLREVLVQVVRQTRLDPETDEDLAALRDVVRAHRRDFGTAVGRRTFVVESLRIAADSDYRRLAESREWRDHLALRATCDSLPAGDLRDAITAELAAAERTFAGRRATVYARLPAALGYRLVPWLDQPTGFAVMAAAAGALLTGLVVRPGLAHEGTFRSRAFGSSVTAVWTTESYALVALILSYVEPDPNVEWTPARVESVMDVWDEFEREVRRLRSPSEPE
jgi:AcrR family transcriptional regulator